MTEFLKECFLTANLPATALLLLVLGYWLMVIVGVLGMDAFDLDLDLEGDFDVDGGLDGDVHGGPLSVFLEFMYLGEVPVVIVGSFFVLFMWIVTMMSNHYLNSAFSFWVMLMWIVPNIIISLLLTKFAISPFSKMFKNYDKLVDTREYMIGQIGMVKTSEVTDKFGQLEIAQDGPPLVINARTRPGIKLGNGDAARILSYNSNDDTYLVELSKWEKN